MRFTSIETSSCFSSVYSDGRSLMTAGGDCREEASIQLGSPNVSLYTLINCWHFSRYLLPGTRVWVYVQAIAMR